jgi:hypothetical protein
MGMAGAAVVMVVVMSAMHGVVFRIRWELPLSVIPAKAGT